MMGKSSSGNEFNTSSAPSATEEPDTAGTAIAGKPSRPTGNHKCLHPLAVADIHRGDHAAPRAAWRARVTRRGLAVEVGHEIYHVTVSSKDAAATTIAPAPAPAPAPASSSSKVDGLGFERWIDPFGLNLAQRHVFEAQLGELYAVDRN